MDDWFILFCLILEVFILSKFDRILFGIWITPFTLLAFPYTIIVVIVFLFAPMFGFIPLYMESVLVWIVGLFLFWLGGAFVSLFSGRMVRHMVRNRLTILYEGKFEVSLLIIAWLTIAIMVIKLWSSVRSFGGIQGMGEFIFRGSYVSGWVGHIMDFSKLLLIFLLGTSRKGKLLQNTTIFAIILLIVPYQSKGSLMLPLMSGLIYRILSGRTTIRVTNVVKISVIIFLLFLMAYFVGYGGNIGNALFDIHNYLFLIKHFFSYLFSGVLAFGDALRHGIMVRESDQNLVFAPILNLYATITSGHIVSIVTDYSSFIDIVGEGSNVHTLFGTLFMFLGYWGSLIYILILSLILNVIFAIAIINRNCWILAVFSLLAGGLVFGWFEFFYWSLTMFEVPVYGLILSFLVSSSVQKPRGLINSEETERGLHGVG